MKSYLFLPLLLLALLLSCKVKKFDTGKLMLKDAYTQKEIPGQPDAIIRDYLKFDFDLKADQNIQINEVLFRNKSYPINSNRKNLKIDLSRGAIAKKKETLKDNEAMIFYSMDGKSHVLTVRNIVAKPPVYLP